MPESIHSEKFNNNKFLSKMKIEENKDMTKVKSIFNLNSISLKKEKEKKYLQGIKIKVILLK